MRGRERGQTDRQTDILLYILLERIGLRADSLKTLFWDNSYLEKRSEASKSNNSQADMDFVC